MSTRDFSSTALGADERLQGYARAGAGDRASGGRFIAGDPLRAVAALSIALLHAALSTVYYHRFAGRADFNLPRTFGEITGTSIRFLQYGLFVFFALSGYLISRPFIRAFVAGDRPPAIVRYVRNRLLRIVPAFWLVLTVALLLSGTLGASFKQVLATYGFMESFQPSNLSLVIGPTWTLHSELGYYLLVPVVAIWSTVLLGQRLGARGRFALVVIFTLTVGVLSAAGREWQTHSGAWEQGVPAMLCAFVPGVLLAAIEIPAEPRLRCRQSGSAIGFALVAIAFPVLVLYNGVPQESQGWRQAITAVGGGLLVAGPLVHQWSTGRAWPILDNRLLHWLGQRSYSIYLIHQLVLYQLRGVSGSGHSVRFAFLLTSAAAFPIVIAGAHLSYRYFERPFLDLRRNWRMGRPAGRA
jgi:acetyltransferase